MQERWGLPSTNTVQAPHTPCSHPTCVPVRLSSSRNNSLNWVRASTVAFTGCPLTVKLISSIGISGSFPKRDFLQTALHGDDKLLSMAWLDMRKSLFDLFSCLAGSMLRPTTRQHFAAASKEERTPLGRTREYSKQPELSILNRHANGLGEFTALAADLVVTPPDRRREAWKFDRGEDFGRADFGSKCPDQELLSRNAAFAPRPTDDNGGADSSHRRYPVGGGIGMREATSKSAAISNGAVGDAMRHKWQKPAAKILNSEVFDLGMREGRTNREELGIGTYRSQFGKVADVDQLPGPSQTQIQHRS